MTPPSETSASREAREADEVGAACQSFRDMLAGTDPVDAWDSDLASHDPARYDGERMTPVEYERRALARRRARAARDARHDRLMAAVTFAVLAAMVLAGLWLALTADGPLGSFAA